MRNNFNMKESQEDAGVLKRRKYFSGKTLVLVSSHLMSEVKKG